MCKTYEVIVERNQDIKDVVNQFILEQGWVSAYISGAIGSIQDVELTTPINLEFPPKVDVFSFEGPAEVLTFTGEVMLRERMDSALREIYASDNKKSLFLHIHASIAVPGSQVYGGGFKTGKAFRKVKVYIQEQD